MSRRRKHKSDKSISKAPFIIVGIIIVGLILGYFYLQTGLELLKRDRVNVVAYGKKTAVYSIGLKESGNYLVPFYPDLKISVPGGYGMYRVGAIGKLISLEKKPELLKKAFSAATSTFIDYYFFAPTQEVYFGGQNDKEIFYPNIADILFHKSNASIGERVAIAYIFLKTPPQQFTLVRTVDADEKGERVLLTDNFNQQYQGYFYRKTYSDEKKEVQILYTEKYDSAETISKILEGNGIRVSDVSQSQDKQDHCRVVEQSKPFSQTAMAIATFFGCELTRGKTDIYDILIELSNKEREW